MVSVTFQCRGTFQCLVVTFCYPRFLLQALSSLILDTCRDGTATAALTNLCQGLSTLNEENFFLISSLKQWPVLSL